MNLQRIVFDSPGEVSLRESSEQPRIESPTQLVLKNVCSLISAGTELACLSGSESWFQMPATPGYIAVGEVLESGAAHCELTPGTRVLTWGPHASHYRIDTTDRYGGLCLALPEGLRPEVACFTRMASIAMTALRVSDIELGDGVLVTGLGLVGNFAAQLAGLQGARVIGVDPCAARRKAALDCGIAHVVNPNDPDWKEQVAAFAGSRGIGTHIEASGMSSVAEQAIPLLGGHASSIQLGSPRKAHETNLTPLLQRVHLPPFTELRGALEWRFPTLPNEFCKHSIERNSRIILELLASGRLLTAPLHTHTLSPHQAKIAYAGLKNEPDTHLGVVFDWSQL